jgi:8-oxo-dGTP pyrophosphatase MutT (NUDIX family)
MRRSESAVALIRREQGGQTLWLARWNPKWRAYHFVAGHQHPGEPFRACLLREVFEELHLREGADYAAAAEPRAHLEFPDFSESAQVETYYTMAVFDVALSDPALRAVDQDPANRWLSAAEIRSGQAGDGKPVSRTMSSILSQLGQGPA